MVTTLQCRIQRDEEDLLPSTNARGSCGGKADQLAEAGISTKGARRYEELACGHGSIRAYNLAIERDEMIMEARDFSMNTTELDKALAHSLARPGAWRRHCPARLRALTRSLRLRCWHAERFPTVIGVPTQSTTYRRTIL